MFDITSTKLLLLGIVALVVIGPKDLPVLLRTLGKYMGIIKRQAAEFRAQFEEAMRESELDQLKKDVEHMGSEAEASMREAERTVTTEIDAAKAEVEKTADTALLDKPTDTPLLDKPSDVEAHNSDGAQSHDADGVPLEHRETAHAGVNGTDRTAEETKHDTEPARVVPTHAAGDEHKSGA